MGLRALLSSLLIAWRALAAGKVVVLILASDRSEHLRSLQGSWRTYMHTQPETVASYFVKADPHLSSNFSIDGDTILVRCPDDGHRGVSLKTFGAMQALAELEPYEFLVRTMLSSFLDLRALVQRVSALPPTKLFCGVKESQSSEAHELVSNSVIILSRDVVEMVLLHFLEEHVYNVENQQSEAFVGILRASQVDMLTISVRHFESMHDFQQKYKASVDGVTFCWVLRLRGSPNKAEDELQMQALMVNHVYSHNLDKVSSPSDGYERVPISLIVPAVYSQSFECGKSMLFSLRLCRVIPAEVVIAISNYNKEPTSENMHKEDLWILAHTDDYKNLNIKLFYRNGEHLQYISTCSF